MLRGLIIAAILSAGAALAEPRLAVHPLELGNFAVEEREPLEAHFEVLVARVQGISVAGTARVEDALSKSAAERCEVRDSCLRFLAEATDSLYGLYLRLDTVPAGVIATGRLVRADGVVVRKVRVEGSNARDALAAAIDDFRLGTLDETLPAHDAALADLTPPPLPPAEPMPMVVQSEPRANWRRVAGWSLVSVGAATLGAGGVFAGLAASNAAANRPDASGAVTQAHARGAALALDQSRIAAVLMPAGAALAVVGAVVLVLPAPPGSAVSVGVAPTRNGLAASLSGVLP